MKFLRRRWYLLVLLIIGLSIVGAGTTLLLASQPKVETALVTRVIDGDTIEIEGGQRVRYIGIDTPEKGEYFFEEATAKNAGLVLGKEVRLEKDVSETDKYGRLLRYVYVGDLFVNAELVRLGYAREAYYPPDTKYCDEFLRLEKYAVASDLGIHNEPIPEKPTPSLSTPSLLDKYRTNPFREQETAPSYEDILSEGAKNLEVSMAYSEYLQAVSIWEQAKYEYNSGTGTYGRCYVTYNNMLTAKQKYESLAGIK